MAKKVKLKKMSSGYLGELNSKEQVKIVESLFVILSTCYAIYNEYPKLDDYMDVVLDLEENLLQIRYTWNRESILQLAANTGTLPSKTYNSVALTLAVMEELTHVAEEVVLDEPAAALLRVKSLVALSGKVLVYTITTLNRLLQLNTIVSLIESEEGEVSKFPEVLVTAFGSQLSEKLSFYYKVYSQVRTKIEIIPLDLFLKLEEKFGDDFTIIEDILFTAYGNFDVNYARALYDEKISLEDFEKYFS